MMITESLQHVIINGTTIMLENAFSELHTIWTDIGFNVETQSFCCGQIYYYIEMLINSIVKETIKKKHELLKKIQTLMEDGYNLCEKLKIKLDTTDYDKLSLLELEKTLYNDVEELKCVKKEHEEAIKGLITKEYEICKRLDIKPIGIESLVLSEEELNNFKLHIEKLEQEKNHVECVFQNLRDQIIQLMDNLEITPSNSFEQIVYNNPEKFILNSLNISKLTELAIKLKKQSEEKVIEDMKKELITLWKILGQPSHICQEFFNKNAGDYPTMIEAFRKEIKRCEEQKQENIANYVKEARNELQNLWNLCKFGKLQREQFILFSCNSYNDELLTLYKLEINKVREMYERNRTIFDLLDEREKLCKKMKELQLRANSPNRFRNRGGQLLTEERERKVIQKKLPKIEEQLRCLSKEYKIRHKKVFIVNDLSLDEFLANSWSTINAEENFQKSKKSEK